MDAVEKAKSGHPGAPMALAPLAYLLYTRDDEAQPGRTPDWFDRDRFVLSAGPRLDAALLVAVPVRATGSRSTTSRTSASSAARPPATPSAATPPAIEATTGPLGQGISMAVGLALAEAMLAARFNRAGPRADRPPHLRDRQRRRHAGGRRVRGLLARRPPRARQADRLLRQQPHPARRRDRDGVLRGRRRSASRPTAGTCRTSARTSSSSDIEAAIDAARRGRRPALADHAAHAHRLRLAEQAGHPRGARLAARRGRGAPDQGGLRLGPGRPLPRPRRGARRTSRRRPASAAREPRPSGRSGPRPTARSTPSVGELLDA